MTFDKEDFRLQATIEVPVLDKQTARLIHGRFSDSGFGEDPKKKNLEQMIQTPLTDLDVINERLDAIGELVAAEDLRKKFGQVVTAFNYHVINLLYSNIKELALVPRPYFADMPAKYVRANIRKIAEAAREFPASFGVDGYQTVTIQDLASSFNSLMASHSGRHINEFFSYMIGVDDKLTGLEKAFQEQHDAKATKEEEALPEELSEKVKTLTDLFEGLLEFQSESREAPPTLEWILKTVDFEKIIGFMEHVNALIPVYSGVYPYYELAEEAVRGNYVRPEVVPKGQNCLIIKKGRWERAQSDSFFADGKGKVVPNHTRLNNRTRVEVLEGVNDGGKTFDMRKAFYIAARALAGTWVPAEYAKVSIRDRIIMRMKGTGNTISALQQDCNSANEVIPSSGEYLLIGMDETFRSTEAHGGQALTAGLINTVIEQGNSLMIVSSHYPDLSRAYATPSEVKFTHFPFKIGKDPKEESGVKVTFPHTKRRGPMNDYSYAIAVARANSFNETVLKYAEERIKTRQMQQ